MPRWLQWGHFTLFGYLVTFFGVSAICSFWTSSQEDLMGWWGSTASMCVSLVWLSGVLRSEDTSLSCALFSPGLEVTSWGILAIKSSILWGSFLSNASISFVTCSWSSVLTFSRQHESDCWLVLSLPVWNIASWGSFVFLREKASFGMDSLSSPSDGFASSCSMTSIFVSVWVRASVVFAPLFTFS